MTLAMHRMVPQPTTKPSLDAASNAYTTLFKKYSNALFVAAAGAARAQAGRPALLASGSRRLGSRGQGEV